MSTELNVTENEAKYLKLIYRKQCEESRKVKTTTAAKAFGIRPATVTEVLQNLAGKGFLRYESYHGVELTKDGIVEAQKLLRKHRILEVLLADLLSYGPEKACEEASNLDYYVSRDFVNDVCSTYGHPGTCPCDKKIFSDPICRRTDEERKS